eukprot:1806333-Pyramimonas_sp.AAC.1
MLPEQHGVNHMVSYTRGTWRGANYGMQDVACKLCGASKLRGNSCAQDTWCELCKLCGRRELYH